MTKISEKDSPVFIHRPAYVRIPRVGEVCPVSGLRKDCMQNLVVPNQSNGFKPPVKSFVMRNPSGKVTLRLVHVESLLAWMGDQANE